MNEFEDVDFCLDLLCPMHVLIDENGRIQRAGSTLQKLRPNVPLQGRMFLDVFEVNRPRAVVEKETLMAVAGAKLHLSFRDVPMTGLKGVLVPRKNGRGAIVDLSFGISILDAVQDYALTNADFSATDLTVELLYLVEAKSAAMEASRSLNLRLQGAMIAAEEQAFTDTLTGLKNRRAMDHILDRLLIGSSHFALMNLDLDFFKTVNDTLGHAAGDFVLQQVALIMVEETRQTDIVARVGGDEFVLIFDGVQERGVLDRLARRLIGRLEEPMSFNGEPCRISASIGTTLASPEKKIDATRLLHQADLALYAAKKGGRAQHVFYQLSMEGSDPVRQATG